MTGNLIEEELAAILGAASPPGLVITLRRHDEYEKLIERIRELESDKRSLGSQLHRMATYPVLYLEALDDLRTCCDLLRAQGVDTSFVRALRSRRRD